MRLLRPPLLFMGANILLKRLASPSLGITISNLWNPQTSHHTVHLESIRHPPIEASFTCPVIFFGESSVNMKTAITAISIRGEVCIMIPASQEIIHPDMPPPEVCITTAAARGPVLAIADGNGRILVYNQDASCIVTGFTKKSKDVPLALSVYRTTDEYLLLAWSRDGNIKVFHLPWAVAHSRSETRPPVELKKLNSIRTPAWMLDITKMVAYHKHKLLVISKYGVCVIHLKTGEIFFEKRTSNKILNANIIENKLILDIEGKRTQTINLFVEIVKHRQTPNPFILGPESDNEDDDDDEGEEEY